MTIRIYTSIITLNAPTKRHRLAEWIKNQDCIYAVYKIPTSDVETRTE